MKKVIVKIPCKFCGANMGIPMTEETAQAVGEWQVKRYDPMYHVHLQDILPMRDFSPEQREIFLSGMCPKCWDKIFDGIEE